jgi:hypothetical protein
VYKTLTLTLLLLISAAWLQAQDAGKTLTTIQGCLQYANGHYRLTEDNGTTHQLQSEANKLTKQVGHEVQLTGMPATRSVNTTVQGTASTVKQVPVFKVKTVKSIADTCTSPGH